MRIVFIGAGTLGIAAAGFMLENGHEVVLIDQDPDKIDSLADELDCGLVCGDGSSPSVLRDVGPGNTDFLICLSDSDQDNIIAALVGRKLEFGRVVVRITDPELVSICAELDIDDVIVPDQEVGRALADMVDGNDTAELTAVLKRGLRFFSLTVSEAEEGAVSALELPTDARVIAVSRDEESRLADGETVLEPGDEVLVLAGEDGIETLRERFKSNR